MAFLALPGAAIAQSYAVVDVRNSGDTSTHQLSVPSTTSSGLGLHWTLSPPKIEIQGLAEITNHSAGLTFKETIPANEQDKYILTQAGGQTVIGGKNDLKRVDLLIPTVLATATGRWSSGATAVPGTGVTMLQVAMHTAARVDPGVDPLSDYSATAAAAVLDPFTFPALAPGENLELTSTLPADQLLKATGLGTAQRELRVGTNLAGFESLYALILQASETNGVPTLSAAFSSHPLLGLDNGAIASAVETAFAFDPVDQSFGLADDFILFNGPLPLPSGLPFELYIDDAATTRIVPEPSSLVLIGLGASALLRKRREERPHRPVTDRCPRH